VSPREREDGHERERLSAWLDGELEAPDAAAVEAHVAACAECAALAADMAAVDERFREAPVEAPSGYFEAFPGRVRARIEAEPRRVSARRIPGWTWAVAAALLLAVVTPLTWRGPVSVPPAATTPGDEAVLPAARPAPPAGRELAAVESKAEAARAQQEASPDAGAGSNARAALQKAPAAPRVRPAPPVAAQSPTLLDRVGEADRQTPPAPVAANEARRVFEKSARPDVAEGVAGGVEGGVPGGVVGGVVGGVERESAPGFATAPAEARTRAEDSPRRAATAALSATDAIASREMDEATSAYWRLVRSTPSEATPRTAGEWRRLRGEWLAFAASYPAEGRADEARVRAVEAAFEAARASGAAADRSAFTAEAAAYLQRPDAAQRERVRALVTRAEAPPR
jgi:anti-sigma factor RsiW